MHVVLVEPEIPPNTGNVARLCAATRTWLHLIAPLGFSLTDRELKRAGMDYWAQVQWKLWSDWNEFQRSVPSAAKLWFIESGGPQLYSEARFEPGDYLVFGRETAGLPRGWLEAHRGNWLSIPMLNPESRSLNLSNCVAIVLYEALRQQGFDPQRFGQDKDWGGLYREGGRI